MIGEVSLFLAEGSGAWGANTENLRRHLGLATWEDLFALLQGFEIWINNERIQDQTLDAKTLKSAGFLLKLANDHGVDEFVLTKADRAEIITFYTIPLVVDTMFDPEINHTTIENLLNRGQVKVVVKRVA